MARQKKSLVEIKDKSKEELERLKNEEQVLLFIKLVEIVRSGKSKKKSDEAFSTIVKMMETKIQKISYKFQIPGYGRLDVYQEALYALRYKAIKDYDQSRSNVQDISPFDRFAILCIRRHLSTKLKSSYQNKSRVLNSSVSLDQNRNDSSKNDDLLFLIDVITEFDSDIVTQYGDREYNKILFSKLAGKLSEFEKEVFVYYAQRLSYDEIVEKMNKKRVKKVKVNIKSVDNALSRVKQKARDIFKKYKDF